MKIHHSPPISAVNGVGIIDRYNPYFVDKLLEFARDLHLPPALIGLSFTQGSKWSAGPLITFPDSKQILFHKRNQPQIAGGYALGFAGGGFSINRPLKTLLDELHVYVQTDDFAAFPENAREFILKEIAGLEKRLDIYNERGFDPTKLESPAVTAMIMAHMKTGIVVDIPEKGIVWNNIFKEPYAITNEGTSLPAVDGLYKTDPKQGEISGIPMKAVVPVSADGKREILKNFREWKAKDPSKAEEELKWLDRIELEDEVEQGTVSLDPSELAAIRHQYDALNGMASWRDKSALKTA